MSRDRADKGTRYKIHPAIGNDAVPTGGVQSAVVHSGRSFRSPRYRLLASDCQRHRPGRRSARAVTQCTAPSIGHDVVSGEAAVMMPSHHSGRLSFRGYS